MNRIAYFVCLSLPLVLIFDQASLTQVLSVFSSLFSFFFRFYIFGKKEEKKEKDEDFQFICRSLVG
jgi:predicted membrane chloride channel (bestrophin family)